VNCNCSWMMSWMCFLDNPRYVMRPDNAWCMTSQRRGLGGIPVFIFTFVVSRGFISHNILYRRYMLTLRAWDLGLHAHLLL
jgi:hypothetical protein